MSRAPLLLVLLLCACGPLVPVKGAPEVQIRDDMAANVTILPDGTRIVSVANGEDTVVTVLLPPAPAPKAEAGK